MSDHRPIDPAKLKRQQRLEEQLKENLRRRKEQARSRRSPAEGVDKSAYPQPDPGVSGPRDD